MGSWKGRPAARAVTTVIERRSMDARELHQQAVVIDSHNDTIVAHIRRGNLSLKTGPEGSEARKSGVIAFLRGPEKPRPGAENIQINFPKMRKAGIHAGFFAIDVTLALKNHLGYAVVSPWGHHLPSATHDEIGVPTAALDSHLDVFLTSCLRTYGSSIPGALSSMITGPSVVGGTLTAAKFIAARPWPNPTCIRWASLSCLSRMHNARPPRGRTGYPPGE